ncbi:MAG: ATP-binding protein [Bacteroidetes bacterium]|nr:ATP-binding protein [Bacteroidota bacterium]
MKQDQKTLRLQSVPSSLNQLEIMIEEVCDKYNLNHNYLGCITVALTEAFQNALEHGNKNNPGKFITIHFEKNAGGLFFSVKDEGEGFNFKDIPEIKDDGKQKSFPGRGIFLMKSLSDELNFLGNGSEVAIGFKISSINIETAVDRMSKFKEYTETSHNQND